MSAQSSEGVNFSIRYLHPFLKISIPLLPCQFNPVLLPGNLNRIYHGDFLLNNPVTYFDIISTVGVMLSNPSSLSSATL